MIRPGSIARQQGFTLLEVMISMAIFMMVMTAIYSTWVAILRGSRAGLQAAANAQRARISMRCLQEALTTAVNFPENGKYYRFLSVNDAEYADIEFTARLPASFPGVGRFSGAIMRRVQFRVESGEGGSNELVVYQKPLFLPEDSEAEPYRLVLSPNVSLFKVEFFDFQKQEYLQEWKDTNRLPTLVKVAIGQGHLPGKDVPQDVNFNFINIPAGRPGGMPIPGRGPIR